MCCAVRCGSESTHKNGSALFTKPKMKASERQINIFSLNFNRFFLAIHPFHFSSMAFIWNNSLSLSEIYGFGWIENTLFSHCTTYSTVRVCAYISMWVGKAKKKFKTNMKLGLVCLTSLYMMMLMMPRLILNVAKFNFLCFQMYVYVCLNRFVNFNTHDSILYTHT